MSRNPLRPPPPQSVTLESALAGFRDDPLGFVLFAFPWLSKGTPLAEEKGPDAWQGLVLETLRQKVVDRRMDLSQSLGAIRVAVSSGNGVGKSSLVAWLILWFMSCRSSPQIVVTANTKTQLETKTWRELAKWHKMMVHADQFAWTATKYYKKGRADDWFAAAIPWSKERPEAFAGTHERDVLILFDESAGIPDVIWEHTEGALTTAGAVWCCFGNPTRNTGRFRECWRLFRHRWSTLQVDSRRARMANQGQIQEWIDDWGEDSDFVRVRVKGTFPRAASNQFISEDDVDGALKRKTFDATDYEHAPIVLGCDVARFGDDRSVIIVRQGTHIHEIATYRELDTHQVAHRIIEKITEWEPEAVFVDAGGVGGGVVDNLRIAGFECVEAIGGEAAMEEGRFFNRRGEMWSHMRDWLKREGCLGDGTVDARTLVDLKTDLVGLEYGFDAKNRVQVETREDMRRRSLPSPDIADALAYSFYMPVSKKERIDRTVEQMKRRATMLGLDRRSAGTSWMAR